MAKIGRGRLEDRSVLAMTCNVEARAYIALLLRGRVAEKVPPPLTGTIIVIDDGRKILCAVVCTPSPILR